MKWFSEPRVTPLLKATDGDEALDVALTEQPALILMDMQLPKIERALDN